MVGFSWRGWLERAWGRLTKKRAISTARILHVENLELRTLLTAPVAVNDSGYTVSEDGSLNGVSVLGNDTDEDSDTITTAILDQDVGHGSLTLNADGTFTYIPEANFHGADSFTYFAKDSANETSLLPATVTITVDSVVDLGAVDQSFSTGEDTPLSGDLSTGNSTTSGGTLSYSVGTNGTFGTAVINLDGTFTYTPLANLNGTDTFTYVVTDADAGESASKTVTVTITASSDNPVAEGASITTDEDVAFNGTLEGSDGDNDPLTFSAGAVSPSHGSVTINPDGTFTYTPAANYHGSDTFSFKVNDGTTTSAEATVTVTVVSVVDLSFADVSFTIDEDTPLSGDIAVGGSTTSGGTLGYAVDINPAHGTLNLSPDGSLEYAPQANFNGVDTFTFVVTDAASGETATRTATIAILPVQDLIAVGFDVTTDEDTPLHADLLSTLNSTTSGGALTYTLTTNPSHGSIEFNPDGAFTYTPAANFQGSDSFLYTVTDNAANESAVRMVTITVAAVDDAPQVSNSSITTDEDVPFSGTLTGSDVDGGTLIFVAGAVPASHGSVVIHPDGTFTYTPATDYHGPDAFTFLVNDGNVDSAEATVTITVNSVDDAPQGTVASYAVRKNGVLAGTLTGTDAEGSPLTFAPGTTGLDHGTVLITPDGTFLYTPDAGYSGSDTFAFIVNDGTSNSAEATITITVADNAAPMANAADVTTVEDMSLNGQLTGTDAESDPLTFHLGSTTPSNGTVVVNLDGTFVYTPAANYHGTDAFTFYVNDGLGNSAEATISITVTPDNDVPTADGQSITTDEDAAFSGTLTGAVDDGADLTFSAGLTTPNHGTVVINPDGTFTYTPAANFSGTDSFSFKVNDGRMDSTEAVVVVTVSPANDAPTVSNGTATVAEDGVLNSSVSPLGFDVDGDALTYVVVTAPQHGSLAFSPDGTYTYTPDANYFGADTFTFQANDGSVDSGVGTVTLNVTSVNDLLELNLSEAVPQVEKNNLKVQLDATAELADADGGVNVSGARIQVGILSGNAASDKGARVRLSVRSQGTGANLVKVKGSKIYFNGSKTIIGRMTGGTNGRPLVITFTGAASETAVNAVLKQLTIQASKKATTGIRTIGIEVVAGGQTAQGTKTVSIG